MNKHWRVWNKHHPDDKIEHGDRNVIHHINGDPSDNRIENLQKMTLSVHSSLHMTGKNSHRYGIKASKEMQAKLSEVHKGHKHSPETRTKISEANTGKKRSKETRAKMSAAAKCRIATRTKIFIGNLNSSSAIRQALAEEGIRKWGIENCLWAKKSFKIG